MMFKIVALFRILVLDVALGAVANSLLSHLFQF